MVTISPNALCPVCRHRILSELRRKHAHLIDEKLLTRIETGAIPPPAPVQVAVSETLSLWDEIDHGLFDEIYLPPSPRNLRPRRPSLQTPTNKNRRSSTPNSIAASTGTPPVTAATSRANSSANLDATIAAASGALNLKTTSATAFSAANSTSASFPQNPTDSFNSNNNTSSSTISTPKSSSSNSSSCSTRFTDIIEVRHRQPKTPRTSTKLAPSSKFKTASTQTSKSCETAAIPAVAISNKFFISHEVISTDATSLDVTLNDASNEVCTQAVSNEASTEPVSNEITRDEAVFSELDCDESVNVPKELAPNIVSNESQDAFPTMLKSASKQPSQTSKKNTRRKLEPDTCVPRLTRSIAAVLTAVDLAIAAESVRVTRSMDVLETRAVGLGPPKKMKR
ncbi:hypothetical protein HDU78_005489 [Chytriomyces hyalinus]|nr:hypothetical protein HDU78_005489 [Chytriomyces hyalinus]